MYTLATHLNNQILLIVHRSPCKEILLYSIVDIWPLEVHLCILPSSTATTDQAGRDSIKDEHNNERDI